MSTELAAVVEQLARRYLRELLSSEEFETSKQKLPLCLGKTIGGEHSDCRSDGDHHRSRKFCSECNGRQLSFISHLRKKECNGRS